MIEHARAGRIVVRLKGGDAFVFGRAAEEIAEVEAAGIAIDIVPGITAAQACAVDARLPLTYRGEVRQISLVTGASIDGAPDLDWDALARAGQALAIYMGVGNAGEIARTLMEAGTAPDTSVVIVENGGRSSRRIIEASLADLAAAMVAYAVRGPAILFVGLDWSDAGLCRPAHVERFQAERSHRTFRKLVDAPLAPTEEFALPL